jgi:hypothetical protein
LEQLIREQITEGYVKEENEVILDIPFKVICIIVFLQKRRGLRRRFGGT